MGSTILPFGRFEFSLKNNNLHLSAWNLPSKRLSVSEIISIEFLHKIRSKIKSLVLKKMLSLFLAISISYGIFSCGSSKAEEAKISLPTIMCGMCEANIKDAFSSTNGIFKVNVDLDSKSGQVFYNSKKVSLAQIETAISNVGYRANNKKAVKSAYDKLPRCCKIDG